MPWILQRQPTPRVNDIQSSVQSKSSSCVVPRGSSLYRSYASQVRYPDHRSTRLFFLWLWRSWIEFQYRWKVNHVFLPVAASILTLISRISSTSTCLVLVRYWINFIKSQTCRSTALTIISSNVFNTPALYFISLCLAISVLPPIFPGSIGIFLGLLFGVGLWREWLLSFGEIGDIRSSWLCRIW